MIYCGYKSLRGVIFIRYLFVIVTFLMSLLVVGCGTINSNVNSVMGKIEEEKYQEASEVIIEINKDEKIDSDTQKQIEDKLGEKIGASINNMFEKFKNKEIKYSEYKEKVDGYKKLNIEQLNKKINEVESNVTEIKLAREYFEKGEEAFNNKQYEDAITSYGNISKEDEGYEIAVQKMEQSKEELYWSS